MSDEESDLQTTSLNYSERTDEESAGTGETTEAVTENSIVTKLSGLFKTTSEGDIYQEEGRSRRIGWVLLGIGLFSFTITIVHYKLHWKK